MTLQQTRLQAPDSDGGVLIEPAARAVPQLLAANRDAAGPARASICGLELGELRRRTRQLLELPVDRPVIAVGHQPELYHAGVWAKGVVGQRLAELSGARIVHLVVDHDKIRQRHLAIPRVQDGVVQLEALPLPGFDRGEIYEQLATWTPADLATLQERLASVHGAALSRAAPLATLLDGLREHSAASGWVPQYVAALARVDAELGVRLDPLLASRLDFGCFFAELIAGARRFAACYNAALAAYRAELRIAGNRHPMPDLRSDDRGVELPLWVIHGHSGRRERLHVRTTDRELTLLCGDQPMRVCQRADFECCDAAAAVLRGLQPEYVLRPRALTLTLWARLVLCDLFVHGIGGAKYDRITDLIIADYFGIPAPHFAVVSATARLDLPRHGASQQDRALTIRRLRDLQYNPQRFVPPGARADELQRERAEWVERAAGLRRDAPRDRRARQKAFDRIRQLNAALGALCADQQQALRGHLDELGVQLRSDAVADSREFFYCLHPRDRLQALKQRLTDALDATPV